MDGELKLEQDLERALTEHLRRLLGGDRTYADALVQKVLPKMRRIAFLMLGRYGRNSPLTPMELVNEAWVKSLGEGWKIENRRHFFAIVALAMRGALVDFARRQTARRRGSGIEPYSDNSDAIAKLAAPGSLETLALIGVQMERREKCDPKAARIVDMHYFAGFSLEEISEISGLTFSQVRYLWERGRDRLKDALTFPSKSRRATAGLMRRRFVDLGLRWILALVSTIAAAQQVPFVHFTGANAPNTSSSLFEDKRGGLLMGGN